MLKRCLSTAVLVCALVSQAHAQTPLPDDFNPVANGTVYSLAVQADGKILVGGDFNTLGGQSRTNIGRLNADGTLDASFNPGDPPYAGYESLVLRLAVQADGKILVVGSFAALGGQSRANIGRLNADGTLDTSFNPGTDSEVTSLAVQADGKIVVGGAYFSTLGGQLRRAIGRLNADGSLDASFKPGIGGGHFGLTTVRSLAVQEDGKILVGGDFNTLGGQSRNYIGRLNADGTIDLSFNPGADYVVSSLALQADGKILVGGGFTVLGGESRNGIARLNEDGTLDLTFNPGAGPIEQDRGGVNSLAVQADGRILVGGGFTVLGGQSRNSVGRLNVDGTLDTSFNPGAGSPVFSLALQADGKILVGGSFCTLGGQGRVAIGRLSNTGPATQSLTFDGSTLTWLRGGTSPEFWRTTFEYSTNGVTWTNLRAGTRISGGWQLGSSSIPPGAKIRARGYVTGGGWFVESLQPTIAILPQDASFGVVSNQFGFNIRGVGNPTVLVEGSSNLVQWIPLYTNTLSNDSLYFSDPDWSQSPVRFYRTRLWP